jgi:hypothetical protein
MRCGRTKGLALVIGQGFLASLAPALALVQEDGQRAKEGEVARDGGGVAEGTAVFVLGAITVEVLAILDAPMHARPFEQLLRGGFIHPETGDQVGHLGGVFDDEAFADGLDAPCDADQLGCSGQTYRFQINRHAPEFAFFDPTVFFIDCLSLRGERCRAVARWLRSVACGPIGWSCLESG